MDNEIRENDVGIKLEDTDGTIKNNYINNSISTGLYAYYGSNDNTIYLNHFSTNVINAREFGNNNWYYEGQGNYWDDYNDIDIEPDGTGDGIGDNYYTKGGVMDKYPLGVFLRAPSKPYNPSPSDGQDNVGLMITLSVTVYDPDDEDMDVYFYRLINTSTGDQISYQSDLLGVDEDVESGGTATYSFNLEFGFLFFWRVEVYDSKLSNSSDIWFFTTRKTPGDNEPPVAVLSGPDYIALNGTANFNALNSYDPDGVIEFYRWNFGDDTSEILSVTPSHTYNRKGYFEVTLTVIDDNGTSDLDKYTIKVGGTPMSPISAAIAGTYEGYKTGDEILFSATVSGGTNAYNVLSWDFGDGSSGSGSTSAHNYQKKGTYDVTFTVVDTNGNTDSDTITIVIQKSKSSSSGGIPGFELIFVLAAVLIVILLSKKYKK